MLKREVLNRLLIMRLIQLSNGVDGKTRLQKLVFETETRIRKIGSTQTFNYKFIRWHYGPFSKELTKDVNFLLTQEFMIVEKNRYILSTKGREFLKKAEKITKQFNNEEIMFRIVTDLNNLGLNKLLKKVYEDHGVKNYKMGEVIEDLKYIGVSD
jgi:uncharacterized protein YwgA